MHSLIPDEARARIGTVLSTSRGAVVRRDWQRWAAAVGDHNPLYFDADYARAHGYRDVIAPPLYLQYAVLGVNPLDQLRPDGTPAGGSGLDFPRCPKRMAGGEDFTFHAPAYHGDEATAVRTVAAIEEKQGRSGRFVLVTWSTRYTNQDDDLLAEATTSLIARP